MKIEVHILQSFPPSCLNRDDTNTPKDCEFGGVRRARVSSQCLKRAMREYFRAEKTVEVGERTKRLRAEMLPLLADLQPANENELNDAVDAFISTYYSSMDSKKPEQTSVLLFLSRAEMQEAAACFRELWSVENGELRKVAAERRAEIDKNAKKKAKKNAPEDSANAEDASEESAETVTKKLPKLAKIDKVMMQRLEMAALSPDIALFGRMMAEQTTLRVDAAAQVAHAISTHAAHPAMDFYSAVDDLNKDDSGAGMLGVTGYTSACFYRYALLDRDQLAANLGTPSQPDLEAADNTIRGFLEAAVDAIPSAKQNSMAAQNRPELTLFVVRDGGSPASFANAFARPVSVDKETDDLVGDSVLRLGEYSRKIFKVYGTQGIRTRAAFSLRDDIGSLQPFDKGTMQAAIDAVMDALNDEPAQEEGDEPNS